jgi:hypothetical protein
MALATAKTVYLHTPKCGGTFIRQALTACNLDPVVIGDQHGYFPELFEHKPESFFRERFVYTFVRHPATWYQSRWCFRMKTGWQSRHPLDWHAASNDFHQFVENALAYKPDGWCSWLFNEYINSANDMVRFIGRQEFLVEDFLEVMRLAGEPIDEEMVRAMLPINQSVLDGNSSRQMAKYTPKLLDRVLAVENDAIQRYYRHYELNKEALCE